MSKAPKKNPGSSQRHRREQQRRRLAHKRGRAATGGGPWFAIGVGAILVVGVAVVILLTVLTSPAPDSDTGGSGDVAGGKQLYEANCGQCHGIDLQGTDSGPPFLDATYAPNHHADAAFYAAAANGVQPHHWDFGAMPAQPSVSRDQVADIIAYVRSEQKKAGITRDPSHP